MKETHPLIPSQEGNFIKYRMGRESEGMVELV